MKRPFFTLLSYSLLLILMCTFGSCSDWNDDGNSALANLDNAPPIVRQAQYLLEGKTLLSVDTHSGDSILHKARTNRAVAASCERLKPQWDKYYILTKSGQEAVAIPLSRKKMTAYAELSENGRACKHALYVKSNLIVRRDSVHENLIPTVVTYLYDRNYLSAHGGILDSIGYDLRGVDYTGYFITSRIDGTMLQGIRYVKGREKFRFCANPLHPEDRDAEDFDEDLHLYLDMTAGAVETRALTVDDVDVEDVSNLRCSFCNKIFSDCQCVVITNCRYCKKRKEECVCDTESNNSYCPTCNQLITNGYCNCCILCSSYPCICNQGNGNGGTGGGNNSSSQGSGNSSVGSGGSSGGGTGSGKPDGGASEPTKVPVGTLTSKAQETVSAMKSLYGTKHAVCNFGVQAMFKQIYGEANLPPGMSGRANDMVSAWANNPSYWHSISLSEAQNYANQGYFVVAGYYNSYGSGHVVVVVPGEAAPSASWGCNVPQIMDTGRNKRSSKIPLSAGFSSNVKENVYFYYYKK